jgi:vacuolar-type H+-ATPase subunit I/STV1
LNVPLLATTGPASPRFDKCARRASAFVLLLGAWVLGCDGPKYAECEKLMGVINAGLDQIEASQQQLKNTPDRIAELRAMADSLDKLAENAGAVKLETPELRELSTRYQRMAKEASNQARLLAEAESAKKLDDVKKAKTALNEAIKQEDPIVADLNKTCSR